jgi:hypothetical protein
VPLGFSPIRPVGPAGQVIVALPLLDCAGAKMSQLEEVVGDRLKAEGHVLAEVVA